MERFDCERCGVNVAYHGWPCIAITAAESMAERNVIGAKPQENHEAV